MNLKEKLTNVFALLGLTQKAKDQSLTDEEWKSVCDRFQKEYQTTLQEAMAEEQAPQNILSQEQITEAYQMLQGIVQSATDDTAGTGTTEGASTEGGKTATQQKEQPTMQQVLDLVNQASQAVTRMAHRAAPDIPQVTAQEHSAHGHMGAADPSKFLFGIDSPFFSMSERWNQITVNPGMALASSPDEEKEGASFRKQVIAYSRSLQKRYAWLHAHNLLNQPDKLAAGEFSTNYDGVTSLPGGNQFVVLRQDALIARVLLKRDLTQYFPVRYGIQDTDLIFNAYFTEVSQAYQAGEVFKGDMAIENERGYVDDAMIKLKFGPMKELECMYIGYLNKEGSDPIKWSMIEFCILHSLETAQVEQNKRRMRGIYVKPEQGVAGPYLNSGTGVIYTLIRYMHENKILPHDDEAYRSYGATDMLDAVQEFHADVVSSVSEDTDLDNMCIYLNKNHLPWWIKCVRAKYGKDIDFTGPDSYKNVIPDTTMRIVWLPYMGQLPLMFIQEPGNIQFLENLAGEMMNFKVKEDMELVKGWSTWKEGCSAAFVGRNFSTAAALKENNYDWQQIFINKPVVSLEADATKADAKQGFWFGAVDNAGATKLTEITGAKQGVAYIVECLGVTNATAIEKSGNFDGITAAWTPTAVGDYIMVILNSSGKFVELERCVGGNRTVNKSLQPNIPGVR